MPGIAKAPISHAIIGEDGKIESVLSFKAGEHISDENLDVLGGHHDKKFVPVPHNDHTCPESCSHDAHADRFKKADEAAVAAPPKDEKKPAIALNAPPANVTLEEGK